MTKLMIGTVLCVVLTTAFSAQAEVADPLLVTPSSNDDGTYSLVVEVSNWRFNELAPLDKRIHLSLKDRSFDGRSFEFSGSEASLTFQASSSPQGELTVLICRATECRRVVRTLHWPVHEQRDHNRERDDVDDDNEDEMVMPDIEGEAAGEILVPEVVVTGTRAWQSHEDAPVHAQVIARDQIEQRNARNVAEALSYTTGVRIETNCQNCGFTQLRLNGLGGDYTQILVDGLPSFSGLAAVYGLEQIPTEILERVVVVRGGGSALYGPSAVAGVVDLVTRRPTENYFQTTMSYEHVGLSSPDMRLSIDGALLNESGTAAAHMFATSRGRNDLDLSGDGFSDLTMLRQLAAGSNLFYAPFGGGNLRLSFHALREYRRGGDQLDLPPHAAEIAEELQTERYQADLRWRHSLTPHVAYAVGYVFSYTDRRSYYGGADEDLTVALGGYGRTLNPLHIGDAHVDLSYELLGPQVITLGLQGSVDHIEDKFVGFAREIDDTYLLIGTYLQHHWIFADWGETILGVRVDKHSELEHAIPSPRGALMLRPLSWMKLRTAVSTGFRAPQVFDEDLHVDTVGGGARLIVNADGLEAERSLSVTQQVATDFTLANGTDLRFSVSGFHTRLRDAFVLNSFDSPTSAEVILLRTNRATTTVLGGELEAGIYTPIWALRSGWTLERAVNQEPDEDFGERRIFRTPTHYGYIDGLFSAGALRLVSGIEVTGPMRVPRYNAEGDPDQVRISPWFFNWSSNINYAVFPQGNFMLETFVGVRNIMDSRQRDLDLGPKRDAGYVYGPAQPRTIFAGIRGRL